MGNFLEQVYTDKDASYEAMLATRSERLGGWARAKLSGEEALRLRIRYLRGDNAKTLSKVYSISVATVQAIVKSPSDPKAAYTWAPYPTQAQVVAAKLEAIGAQAE